MLYLNWNSPRNESVIIIIRLLDNRNTKEWKDCVNELFALENSIFQWIHVEQNLLYPKVTGLGNHYRAGHHHHLN